MEAQTGGLGTKDSMGELWCWGGTRRCLERLREEGPRPGGPGGARRLELEAAGPWRWGWGGVRGGRLAAQFGAQ